MTILFSVAGFTYDSLTDETTRDYAQQPYAALVKALDMVTPDVWDGNPVDALVSWDAPPSEVYRAVNGARKVLVAFEPFAVHPINWEPALHDLFDLVITCHDGYQFGGKYRKLNFPLPETFPPIEIDAPFAERKLLTHIASNKRSGNETELYSMRVKALDFFQTQIPDQFTYYGVGWPEHPCYGGAPEHKAHVLPNYRFALVIENEAAPGWVTEKIYDAIRCGVVPVYYGAPNIERYVDPAAFIDLRRYAHYRDLLSALQSMDETTWQAYRDAGAALDLTPHYPATFIQTIQQALTE